MTVTVTVASVPEPFTFPALPDGPDKLIIAGLGRHMGDTLTIVEVDGREILHWAGLDMEK